MDTSLSISTLIHCHCALIAHIDSLRSMADTSSTIEFRNVLEAQIDDYSSALAEFDNYFNLPKNE